MSHYFAIALIPAEGDAEKLLHELLAPYEEEMQDEYGEYCRNPIGFWDWYQIGGRWTGALSGGAYEPEEDPRNVERCEFCGGTGARDDHVGRERIAMGLSGCNACDGEGRRVKWPTEWVRHDGDVVPALDVAARFDEYFTDESLPFAFLVYGSETPVFLREVWDPDAPSRYGTGTGAHVEKYDSAGMRDLIATHLFAQQAAGIASRFVVVDYHN